MQFQGLDRIKLLSLVLLAFFVVSCQPRVLPQDSKYGALYFPLSDGRLAFMPADCLITNSECPEPKFTSFSLEANRWTRLSWSSNGAKAFVIARSKPDLIGTEKDELFLLDPQNYSLKSLIRMSYIDDVSWSPDGKWLAVAGVKEGSNASTTDAQIALSAIFAISPDGESIDNLTDGLHGMKHHLSWLDEDTILFEVDDYPNGCGTYSLDLQDKAWSALLEKPNCYVFPQPSPDGKLIAYGNVKSENNNLFVMNADGSNQKLLAGFDTSSVRPFWSSSQDWIGLDITDQKADSTISIISPNGEVLQEVYKSGNSAFATWAPIDEPYLLISELDSKGFMSKWFIISIPDRKAKTISTFEEGYIPWWLSWRPSVNTVSSP